VEYTSYREVKKALDKLDGCELQGRKIELVDDTSSRDKEGRRRGRYVIMNLYVVV